METGKFARKFVDFSAIIVDPQIGRSCLLNASNVAKARAGISRRVLVVGEMEGVGTIAGTVKIINSPKFAPPAVGSGVVRLTWSGSQTPAAVRMLRVEGSHTRFLRSQTQRPFANFALSFWLRKVRLRQCACPMVYRPLPFCLAAGSYS